MIRLSKPNIDQTDIQAIVDVLNSGNLVQGKKCLEFEEMVASLIGSKFAIAVSNCTAALHMSLLALGVEKDDLVITTAFSWLSTANVISLCGAHPIFVDIDPDTFNINLYELETTLKKLSTDQNKIKRIKAIIPVHTFGNMVDIKSLKSIADLYSIPIVEDAACALGASYYGINAGSTSDFSCFSFHPRKPFTTGEGGIITTNNENYANYLRALRNHGQDPNSLTPNFIIPGYNYRITDFQAAMGISQMLKFEKIKSVRYLIANNYYNLLTNSDVVPQFIPKGSNPIYQSFVIKLPMYSKSIRNDIIKSLKSKGIETTIGTYHMPLTTYFQEKYGYKNGDYPVSEDVSSRSISIPIYEGLTIEEQNYIIETLLEGMN